MKRKIVCFGPGPRFKGGIANYNTALAKALARAGAEVHIVSWSQQYPALIPRDFVDRSSKSSFLEGSDISVSYLTDYNRPGTWLETARFLRDLQPEVVIFQWAIALQGLPMGRIARWLKRNTKIEVLFDVHVLVQKEAGMTDQWFTRYGLGSADGYIVHARSTAEELQAAFPKQRFELRETGRSRSARTVLKLFHPVYDLFQPDPAFDLAAAKAEMGLHGKVFLFFGFIRKYKGLHWVIPAFAKLAARRDDVSLLIVGESFWQTLDEKKLATRIKRALFGAARALLSRKGEDESQYRPLELIEALGIQQRVHVVNRFVPNEEVHRYFQASDAILTFYETATPSGVESLAYNFQMPVLATRVGHFPETITDGVNGYLAEPGDIDSMAAVMERFLEAPVAREQVAKSAEKMSWDRYAAAILDRN
jgi:glycosyltransferase involved in cell wall biosynthesis